MTNKFNIIFPQFQLDTLTCPFTDSIQSGQPASHWTFLRNEDESMDLWDSQDKQKGRLFCIIIVFHPHHQWLLQKDWINSFDCSFLHLSTVSFVFGVNRINSSCPPCVYMFDDGLKFIKCIQFVESANSCPKSLRIPTVGKLEIDRNPENSCGPCRVQCVWTGAVGGREMVKNGPNIYIGFGNQV